MNIIFKDESNGHLIFCKIINGNYYYFYKNTKYSFIYPERYRKLSNGEDFYTKNKNYLLLNIVANNGNMHDICLHGFYKNGKLLKNNKNSINGIISKNIKLNYTFLIKSLNHFYSLNKNYIIKSFISKTKNNKDYQNRLFFWKKLGFEIIECNEKHFDHYIIKKNN